MVRTAAVALTLSLLLAPLALAGSANDPEIRDGKGDASPFAVYLATPDGAAAQHAAMYDLVRVWVAGESASSLVFALEVADLPDQWALPTGDANGNPVPPLDAAGQRIAWDDEIWRTAVNHTLQFQVKGQAYRLETTLAEVNLENANHGAPLDTRTAAGGFFAAAHDLLARASANASLLPDVALQATLASAFQAAQERLEDLQVLATASCVDDKGQICPMDAACPSLTGRVKCTEDRKGLCVQSVCKDLHSVRVLVASHVAQVRSELAKAQSAINASLIANGVAHVTAREHAQELLTEADAAVRAGEAASQALPYVQVQGGQPKDVTPPQVMLFSRSVLHGPGGVATDLGTPVIDLNLNTLHVTLDKAKLGAPQRGDVLTRFHAAASFRQVAMDFAPNGTARDVGQTLLPTYGRDYAFTYPPLVDPGPARGIDVARVGTDAGSIQFGGAVRYQARVSNVGEVPAEGFFQLSSAPRGWTFELSAAEFRLEPGASMVLDVRVGAIEGADTAAETRLTAHLLQGASRSVAFLTQIVDASGQPVQPQPPAPVVSAPPAEQDTPGFETLLLLAALGFVAWRRR